MTLVRMLGLSVLMGTAAAGFVWFGWGLIENLMTVRRTRNPKGSPDEEAPRAETNQAA